MLANFTTVLVNDILMSNFKLVNVYVDDNRSKCIHGLVKVYIYCLHT